jgi:hypothetical protein
MDDAGLRTRNAMDWFSGPLRSHWMMEEEEDDTELADDDEAEEATYNYLVESESYSRRWRRRSDAPQKVIRPRDLPSGHKRIKADYFAINPVYSEKQFRRR